MKKVLYIFYKSLIIAKAQDERYIKKNGDDPIGHCPVNRCNPFT